MEKRRQRIPDTRAVSQMSFEALSGLREQLEGTHRKGGRGGHEGREALKQVRRRLRQFEKNERGVE